MSLSSVDTYEMDREYRDFSDYCNRVNKACEKLSDELWVPGDKNVKKAREALNLSLKGLVRILDNIEQIDEMLDNMYEMARLDSVAREENKYAQKFNVKKSNIINDLYTEREKQVNNYYKQLQVCTGQAVSLKGCISKSGNKDALNEFNDAYEYFRAIKMPALNDRKSIGIDRTLKSDLFKASSDEQHKEAEKDINLLADLEISNIDELEHALAVLRDTLSRSQDSPVSKDIQTEVINITKIVSPKVISASKGVVDRLRHSSQLQLDLEQIHNILDTVYGFTAQEGKLRKINQDLIELRGLLESAIVEEGKRNDKLTEKKDAVKSQVDYATDAVREYDSILSGNKNIDREQSQIENGTDPLSSENRRLEQDATEMVQRATELTAEDQKGIGSTHKKEISDLFADAEKNRTDIKINEEIIEQKKQQDKTFVLPPEYEKMKKRLAEMSALEREDYVYAEKHDIGGRTL